MRTCECGELRPDAAKFCPECGRKANPLDNLHLIGDYYDSGEYEVNISFIADVNSHEYLITCLNDALREVSAKCKITGIGDKEKINTKLINPRTYLASHHYKCGTCRQTVSKSTDGNCFHCLRSNWVHR